MFKDIDLYAINIIARANVIQKYDIKPSSPERSSRMSPNA